MRRNRWMTAIVIMLVVASGVLAPLGGGRAFAQNETATPRTTGPGDGGSYESPTYGYTLTYDAVVWTISAEDPTPDDGYDQIALTNGTSYITLLGTSDWDGDQLTACVADYADFRAETEGISDFDPVAGSDEEDDGSASNLYTYTYNDNEFTEYLECRDLETAVVIILHDVASASYDDEVEARDDLLDGLESGDAPESTSTPKSGSRTPVSMGTPTRKETPKPEKGVYTSPSYDYVIPYGDDWQLTSEDSADGIDLLEITNEVSVVTFTGVEARGDAADCLSAAVDALLAEDEYQDFNQAVTGDDDPYEGTGALGPYTGYTDGDTAVYLECGLSPDGDVALLIRVVAPLSDFGNEIGPINDILDAITWTSSSGRATATPDEEARPTEEPSPESENSYVDDENQWSLTWDKSWTQVGTPDEDGALILNNGVSLVYVEVIAKTDDAQDCLRDQLALLTDNDNVSDVSRLRVDDKTIRGGDETAAFSAYSYVYTGDNGPSDMVSYFDCRVLPSGDTALLINQIVTADAYETEAAEVADLIDGLTIGKQSSSNSDPTEEPDATATPDDGATDENSYTNETYDYSIRWDDTWTREKSDDEDVLQLTNGTSTVTLFSYDDGDAESCVEANFQDQSRNYDNLEQALDTKDQPLAGGNAASAFGVYVGTDSGGDSVVISFFCISIGDEVSVVFQHLTTPDAYNDEIDARSALLDALVLPND